MLANKALFPNECFSYINPGRPMQDARYPTQAGKPSSGDPNYVEAPALLSNPPPGHKYYSSESRLSHLGPYCFLYSHTYILTSSTEAEHEQGASAGGQSQPGKAQRRRELAGEGHGSPHDHGLATARPEPGPDSLPA